MGISVVAMKLRHVAIRRLSVVGMFVAVIVVFQCCWTTYYSVLDAGGSSVALPIEVSISGTSEKKGVFRSTSATNVMLNATFVSHSKEYDSEKEADLDHELESDGGRNSREGHIPNNKGFKVGNHKDAIYSFTQKRPKYAVLSASDMLLAVKKPSNESRIQSVEMESQNEKPQVLKSPLSMSKSKPKMGTSSTRSKLVWPTSITQMNSLMLQSFNSSASMVWISAFWFQFEPLWNLYGVLIFHVLCIDDRGQGGLLDGTGNSYLQN